MASITFTNVWKIYGKDIVAVRDLNLVCEDGEFLALLGPSGCGKTSTLRMAAGLEEITAGTIQIGDKVVNNLRPRERDIAMVFETYGLYPHLTVYDNIAFPLRVRKMTESEIETRVQRSAGIVDLDDILDQYPASLGDGQKQRVSIARAIVRQPEIFLFDEPISHLDETLRRRMRKEIKHLQATLGNTLVYVTHDQIEAMAMADRIVVMDLGVVKQVGTPSELYNCPANLFVAGFIGEPPMNLLRGTLVHEDGQLSLRANGFRLPITRPDYVHALEQHGRPEIILGVRPRHLMSSRQPSDDAVSAELYGLEPHGEYNILSFMVGDEILLSLSGPGFYPDPGERIFLTPAGDLHFFDIDTHQSVLYGQGVRHG
jgi:multiple sugar transport system ATP-binding protein